eukprot:gene3031-44228_t
MVDAASRDIAQRLGINESLPPDAPPHPQLLRWSRGETLPPVDGDPPPAEPPAGDFPCGGPPAGDPPACAYRTGGPPAGDPPACAYRPYQVPPRAAQDWWDPRVDPAVVELWRPKSDVAALTRAHAD